MQRGVQVVLKGLGVLSFLYILGYFLWAFVGVDDRHESKGPELTVANSTTRNSIVLLTAVTASKLNVFGGIEDFYSKVWDNRLNYARHHGTRSVLELLTMKAMRQCYST